MSVSDAEARYLACYKAKCEVDRKIERLHAEVKSLDVFYRGALVEIDRLKAENKTLRATVDRLFVLLNKAESKA